MKKIIASILFLPLLMTAGTAMSQGIIPDPGYVGGGTDTVIVPTVPVYRVVREYLPFVPLSSASDVTSSTYSDRVSLTRYYKDGFMGTYKSVAKDNISGRNIISFSETYPRHELKGYLPFPADDNVAREDLVDEQNSYYGTEYPLEVTSGNAHAYTLTDITSGSTARSHKEYAPGKELVGTSRGTEVKKTTNGLNSIRRWKVDANGKPFSPGFYLQGRLFGEQVTGENGVVSTSYVDKTGKLVCKVVSGPSSLITYYVYDDFNRLRSIISPKATATISGSGTLTDEVVKNLCFRYFYDEKGRLSKEQKPGEDGFTELVYDRKGRIVMRRSPSESVKGLWELVFYDRQSRTTATALLTDTTGRNRWQHKVDSVAYTATVPNTNLLYYFSTSAGEGKYPVTISGVEYLSYSYYDHYNHAGVSITGLGYTPALLPETMTGADNQPQLIYNQGLPVISRVKVLNEDHEDGLAEWELSVSHYDTKGRLLQSNYRNATQSTSAQGTGYISIRYDFMDRPLITRSANTNAAADQTAEEYYKYQYYTGSSRLFMSWHRTGSSTAPWQLMQTLTYDDLGRVKREVLGASGEFRDYTYNIRGQLESINGTYANTGNKEAKSRTFGEVLEYERTGNTVKRYDSRISSMIWRGSGGYKMRYDYQYDQAGRLLKADFDEYFGGSWTNSHLDYTVKNISYDLNGNMIAMQQYGMGVVDTGLQPVVLDYLTYTYEPYSNRLQKVTDTVTTDYLAGDFIDGYTGTTDYQYDASGSLTRDRNKDLEEVTYTFFNKPKKIRFKDGSTIDYIYNAAGVKLRETVTPDSGTAYKRDYVGNAVYKDDKLVYISTPQGRTNWKLVEDEESYTEEFFVKDHLGNVRSIISIEPIPFTTEYLATYELSSAYIEGILFDVLGEIREENPEGGSYSGRLRADEYPVGTSLILQVMAGDIVSLEVKNRYDSYNPANDNLISDQSFFQNLLTTMVTGPEGTPAEQGQVQMISSMFGSQNMSIFETMSDMAMDPARPPAALNYILYNSQLQIVGEGSGVIQADGLGTTWSVIGTDGEIVIPVNGFLSVFLSNRSLVTPVYFDELSVKLTKGKLREENHYYPHGLPMAHMGMEAPGSIENRQKHQGNEYIKDLGLNWMDFAARQYDPQIGRFLGVDPLADYYGQDRYSPYAAMGNQPESMVDPNGMSFGPPPVFTRMTNRGEQWGMSIGGPSPSSLKFAITGESNNIPFIDIPEFGGGEEAGGVWTTSYFVEIAKTSPGTTLYLKDGNIVSFDLPVLVVVGNKPDWAGWWKRVEAMFGNNMPWVLDYQPLLPLTWSDLGKGTFNAGADMLQDFSGITGLAVDKFSQWMTGSGIFRYNLETDNAKSVYVVATITLALIEPTPAGEISAAARGVEKAIVIGEGMNRVKQAGRALGAKWYQAWSKFFPKAGKMSESAFDAAKARNTRWLENKIKRGYKIYDIGIDNFRPERSAFYELEQEILRKYNYPTIPISGY